MTDVDYALYGENAVNATYAVEPFTDFLAQNGYAIGAIFAIIIILFIIGFIFVLGFKTLKKMIPK